MNPPIKSKSVSGWPDWASFRLLGGYLFTLGNWLKMTEVCSAKSWTVLSQCTTYVLFWRKKGLGYILGDLFTNSSSHPILRFHTLQLWLWHIGPRLSQKNRRSWVRIPPGCKVYRTLHIAMQFTRIVICGFEWNTYLNEKIKCSERWLLWKCDENFELQTFWFALRSWGIQLHSDKLTAGWKIWDPSNFFTKLCHNKVPITTCNLGN
jgi:hypothetical protein